MKPPATPREWIAPLRHRYTQLFDELGIEVRWDVPASWIVPPSALQCLALTRLIEEGLTNVIKHSRAGRVAVRLAQPDGRWNSWSKTTARASTWPPCARPASASACAACPRASPGRRQLADRFRARPHAPDRQPDPGGGRRRGGPGDGFGARCIEKSHPDVIPGTQPHICKVLTANPTTIAVIHKFQQDDASWIREHLNQSLFLLINADPASPAWRIQAGMFIANRLILLVPAALAGLWLWGGQPQRGLVLKTLTGIGVALFISYLCGALWPHPRPFTIGLGHAFFAHKATSSFPSNHTIIIATLAFTLLFDRRWAGWGWATLALAAVVGLSRVYLGVHFPLDIAGGLLLAPLAAALVMPVWRRGHPVTAACQALHGKLLALPIARGWIRA